MNDLHVTVLVVIVIVVCIQIFHVRSNAELKDLLKVEAKTDGDVYPSSFLATLLHKSDAV
jgi:hypothetical protein